MNAEPLILKAKEKRLLILSTLWHRSKVDQIVRSITHYLDAAGFIPGRITHKVVPGAFDMIAAINQSHHDHDIIFCTGFLLKGQTDHYKYTSIGVMQGLIQLTLKLNKPIVNGIFNCQNADQIEEKVNSALVAYDLAQSIVLMTNDYA